MDSVPLACAAQIYHRFFQETELQDYDPHVSWRDEVLSKWVYFVNDSVKFSILAIKERVESAFFQLIATTALYLAGKVEEQHLKLRDVINVCHRWLSTRMEKLSFPLHSDSSSKKRLALSLFRTLHPKREPLDIGEEYWAMRDSVVQTELLIMRMLQFQVNFSHPHKVPNL